MTGKLRERTGVSPSPSSLSSTTAPEDLQATRQLLFALTRLICREPVLFLQERVCVM